MRLLHLVLIGFNLVVLNKWQSTIIMLIPVQDRIVVMLLVSLAIHLLLFHQHHQLIWIVMLLLIPVVLQNVHVYKLLRNIVLKFNVLHAWLQQNHVLL